MEIEEETEADLELTEEEGEVVVELSIDDILGSDDEEEEEQPKDSDDNPEPG